MDQRMNSFELHREEGLFSPQKLKKKNVRITNIIQSLSETEIWQVTLWRKS